MFVQEWKGEHHEERLHLRGLYAQEKVCDPILQFGLSMSTPKDCSGGEVSKKRRMMELWQTGGSVFLFTKKKKNVG